MAREHARILTSIWTDADFRERTPEAQRAYVLVLSQKGVNNAGVAPLLLKKWARASVHTAAHDLEKPLRELDEHRYLVIDEDTDEVLVRSFIRNDGVWRQPNVLKNALREARVTESPRLRSVLAEELVRVAQWLPGGKGYEGLLDMLRDTVRELDPQRLADPLLNPSGNPENQPSANGRGTVRTNPSPNPSRSRGVGEGVGEGEGVPPSGDGWVGGSRARATPARPAAASASGGPPPLPSELDDDQRPASAAPTAAAWAAQPCGDRHDPDRACRRCGAARRSSQDQADQATLAEANRRAANRRRIDGCQACDDNGWLEHPESGVPVVRCDHETDHRKQLADALDQAS